MDVMRDVLMRLEETDQRAKQVIRRLEDVGKLRHSFDNARRGLDGASANVANLAEATTTAVESLTEASGALRSALDLLRKSDPASVKNALARTDTGIQDVRQELRTVHELVLDGQRKQQRISERMEASHRDIEKRLESHLQVGGERIQAVVERAIKRLSRQTAIDRIFGRYRSDEGRD